jgi:hypothetical protein
MTPSASGVVPALPTSINLPPAGTFSAAMVASPRFTSPAITLRQSRARSAALALRHCDLHEASNGP